MIIYMREYVGDNCIEEQYISSYVSGDSGKNFSYKLNFEREGPSESIASPP